MKSDTEIKTGREKFSDFVEAAAHDLHAPLRKLSVLIDRVFIKHADQFDEGAKEYVSRIESCIAEMQSLIDDLTELAKADINSESITACDLNLIVKHAMETMSDEIDRKQAWIRIGSLPLLHGNEIQYRQLFKNLLENAIKFSKKNETVKIDLQAEAVTRDEKNIFHLPEEKNYYKIIISDNGIGFNNAYAEKIFEPFVRLHSKSDYEGNGLGLSICKKIVANHNGIIYAEGNEEAGSRFILILPETP
jgi:light-regulated signal transduction histidine kinase (bacteriophytochrome)